VVGSGAPDSGSIGAGIVIREGVFVRVSRSRYPSIRARRFSGNGSLIDEFTDSPPLSWLSGRFPCPSRIETSCTLPIGAGFGLSAAALMAAASALNILCGTGLTPQECTGLAHEAEILHHTGLGDVAACQGGGRDYRTAAGPGAEIIRYFDIAEPIHALNFGPLLSPGILGSRQALERVCSAFPGERPDTPAAFFRLSRLFAEASGLMTPAVREVLAECDQEGVAASMTMLGNGVFALGSRAHGVLSGFGDVFELHMADSGVRIGEVQE
jgi:pantoate kinase